MANRLLQAISFVVLIPAPCLPGIGAPPRVVTAHPDNGDVGVDPQTRDLQITFDQPMSPGGMSVVGGGESFPKIVGKPRWRNGGKTFVLRIELEPDHEYQLSINNQRFTNFRNRAGEAAVPYPIKFETGPAGDDEPATADDANRRAIVLAREAVDQEYSYRDRLELDWDALFAKADKSLARSKTPLEFAKKLGVVLAKAEDKHIWLQAGDDHVPSFVRPMVPNANFNLLPRIVPDWQMHGKRVATGRWDDGIAYLAIGSWAHEEGAADNLQAALAAVADARGLALDVRGNGGGSELLARQVAGCFTDKRALYGKHVLRDPGSPSGFSEPHERWLEPNPAGPRIRAQVVVLTGPVVMSSCESFLLMMRGAGATLVGDRSQGSSGNPQPHDLENGVTLFLPCWKDMDADGKELEGIGVAPDVAVQAQAREFEKRDPVLETALRLLREKERRPAD